MPNLIYSTHMACQQSYTIDWVDAGYNYLDYRYPKTSSNESKFTLPNICEESLKHSFQ